VFISLARYLFISFGRSLLSVFLLFSLLFRSFVLSFLCHYLFRSFVRDFWFSLFIYVVRSLFRYVVGYLFM